MECTIKSCPYYGERSKAFGYCDAYYMYYEPVNDCKHRRYVRLLEDIADYTSMAMFCCDEGVKCRKNPDDKWFWWEMEDVYWALHDEALDKYNRGG